MLGVGHPTLLILPTDNKPVRAVTKMLCDARNCLRPIYYHCVRGQFGQVKFCRRFIINKMGHITAVLQQVFRTAMFNAVIIRRHQFRTW
jgi:hypothetical protein